jgi:hypothetical protein
MGKALRTHQKQSDGLDGYVALLLYPSYVLESKSLCWY